MATRKGINFFPLSRSQWTKLRFAAHGVARFVAPLNLSANSLRLSRLDIKATMAQLWGHFNSKIKSSVQVGPPTTGSCGMGRAWGIFAEQLPKGICSWQQEHKPSIRKYDFSTKVSGCCIAVPSPGQRGDQAVLAGHHSRPRHLRGSAAGTRFSG